MSLVALGPLIHVNGLVLLPVSIVGALFLVSQGVIQTLSGYADVQTVGGHSQTLALGPAASQIAWATCSCRAAMP